MASPPPHVSYHLFRHFKQKLWRQERCLGSVNKSEHTEQDTSSRRLWNSFVRSMMASGTKANWPSMHSTPNNEVLWLSIFSFSRKERTTSQSQIVIVKLKPDVKWSITKKDYRKSSIKLPGGLVSPLWSKNAWRSQVCTKCIKPRTVEA